MRIERKENGVVTEWADEGKWLYKDWDENNRQFEKVVSFGKNNSPWPECTQAERDEWEEEHKPEQEAE